MRRNDNPPPNHPSFRPLSPVPDVNDEEIEAVDDIMQDFFAAVDFSYEEDALTYYPPPQSPIHELLPPADAQVLLAEQVHLMAAENPGQPPDQVQVDQEEDENDAINELIEALDALLEAEGAQNAIPVQLNDDEEGILNLRLISLDPQPSHSRDHVTPISEVEGKVLVASSPLQSEFGSPPHLSPYWRNDHEIPYCSVPLPGPSRMERKDEGPLEHEPIVGAEPEARSETNSVPQPAEPEPLPSTSRGSRGIWRTGLALGVDGSGRMTGSNIDFGQGAVVPAQDPGNRKRNISSISSSVGSSQTEIPCSKKADSGNVRTHSRTLQKVNDARAASKRKSRSTSKKRSCNSEEPKDNRKVENIDNPIRPTYPGGAGRCGKKFHKIPGVMEWFAKRKQELELEINTDDELKAQDLELRTWENTRSKIKARRAAGSVQDKRTDSEEAMGLLDSFSEEEFQEEEEMEEEKEDEVDQPRRGRGRPRKMAEEEKEEEKEEVDQPRLGRGRPRKMAEEEKEEEKEEADQPRRGRGRPRKMN